MSMYLPNPDVRPTGVEPGEFIDFPLENESRDVPAAEDPKSSLASAKGFADPQCLSGLPRALLIEM